jgi:hypothetical protein
MKPIGIASKCDLWFASSEKLLLHCMGLHKGKLANFHNKLHFANHPNYAKHD